MATGINIRAEFPYFTRGKSSAYLDSAASSQKPQIVIDRLTQYLAFEHANIHRGAYALSANATDFYHESRATVARFIGAKNPDSVIFVRGTTEAANLLAYTLAETFVPGDQILLTTLEHHSNIVPWQIVAKRKGLKVSFVPVDQYGLLDLVQFAALAKTLKPKIISVTQLSNALGVVTPISDIVTIAKQNGALIAIDAAQAAAHLPIDVGQLECDFLFFSGHKVYGPTGIGVLYGKPELLNGLPPFMGGGDMIETVTVEGSTFAEAPRRFEAGTPAIAEAIALGSALDFVTEIGFPAIAQHERELFGQAFELLRSESGVTVYGPALVAKEQCSIISFNLNGVHPHDLSTIADSFGVQIRGGHHCAMPLMKQLGLNSTARMSLGVYSIREDLDKLVGAIRHARKMFG